MKRLKKSTTVLFMLSLVLTLALGACSSGNNDDNPSSGNNNTSSTNHQSANNDGDTAKPEELKPVELVWYMYNGALADERKIEAAVNEYIKPKINATIDLKLVSGDYAAKLNPVVSSGEKFDIAWVGWKWPLVNNARKGAFYDITELMDQYAPDLKAALPPNVYQDGFVDGKLYGIANHQISAQSPGFVIQKRFVEKYNLDVSTLKKVEDIEPFLKQIKENEPEIIPFGQVGGFWDARLHGIDKVGTDVYYYRDEDPIKVINVYESPEFREYLDLARDWFEKGYVNSNDAATALNLNDVIAKGDVAVTLNATLGPGVETSQKKANNGNDVVAVPLMQPYYIGSLNTMNAISRTSENPERALMFLNLVNSDPELFNLLSFGIEGEHYEKLDGNYVRPIQDSGYSIANWKIGNTIIGYLVEGEEPDKNEQVLKINNESYLPKLFGFTFDGTPVKTEMTAIEAVDTEFKAAITSGTVDPADYYPRWIEARKAAGSDKVLEEIQRQADAWIAENKK